MLKPITPTLHGIIDYLTVPLLLAAGPLSGFGGRAAEITSTVAGAVLVYSAFTRYPPGLVKMIPPRIHRIIDTVIGLLFIIYPHVYPFPEHSALWFFVGFGVFSLTVVILTDFGAGHSSPDVEGS